MANKLSGFANFFNSKALPQICVSTVFYTQQSDGSYLPTGAISLLDNKVNESTLMHCLSLVNDKARLESRDQTVVHDCPTRAMVARGLLQSPMHFAPRAKRRQPVIAIRNIHRHTPCFFHQCDRVAIAR